MNALDHALTHLANASSALERKNAPTADDVEEALGHAKKAYALLKAAFELMDESIYEVAKEPPQPGEPLPFSVSQVKVKTK